MRRAPRVSNTPLQALTLLNDVVFVEAAQALGDALAAQRGPIEDRDRATLFRRCLTRPPSADEVAALRQFFMTQQQRTASRARNSTRAAIAGAGDRRCRRTRRLDGAGARACSTSTKRSREGLNP